MGTTYLSNISYVSMVYRLIMHQSIETPVPQPLGLSGEFNIYQVLKTAYYPVPGAKASVKSPA